MKALLFLLVPACISAGEPRTLDLEYKERDAANYATQIQTKFKKLLASDPVLAKEFEAFEAPPSEDARGKSSGEPTIQVFTLVESEHGDFRDSGGTKNFEVTIVLYYRFDQGMHRGRETCNGFFARFTVTGSLSYRHLDIGEFELTKSKMNAKFDGFSRNLAAPKPEEETQAGSGARD